MLHLSHILFEPVLLRENFLSRLDARIKILWCAAALTANLILKDNIFQITLLFFYLTVALTWRVRFKYIISRMLTPFLIGIFLLVTGLGGLRLGLVILAGVSQLALLSFSTSVEDMLSALILLGCPAILIEIAFLMYKYIFIFFEDIDAIYHAQASRLGYAGLRKSTQSLSILVGMLLIRSFNRASNCYEAILARGYKDKLFY